MRLYGLIILLPGCEIKITYSTHFISWLHVVVSGVKQNVPKFPVLWLAEFLLYKAKPRYEEYTAKIKKSYSPKSREVAEDAIQR